MGRGRRETAAEDLRRELETFRGEPIPEPHSLPIGVASGPALRTLRRHGWSQEDLLRLFPDIPGYRYQTRVVALNRKTVHIEARLHDGKTEAASMRRTLDLEEGVAYHNSLEIDPDVRGKGLGKKLFLAALDVYRERGLQSVELYANSDVGGYFWARMGFELSAPEAGTMVRGRSRDTLSHMDELLWKVRDLQERYPGLQSLNKAEKYIETNIEFLEKVLASEKIAVGELALFRPRMGLSREDGDALLRAGESEETVDLLLIDGEETSLFSGKEMLLGSGWSGTFQIGNSEQEDNLRSYAQPQGEVP